MGVLSSLFEQRLSTDSSAGWFSLGWGSRSKSGVNVGVDGSMTSSAVWACVRVRAESVASLPLIVYRRTRQGKERAVNHPLYSLLHDLPNPEITSYELRQTLMMHLDLWGNAYCEIVWDDAGQVRELWPLLPGRMTVERKGEDLLYSYRLSNEEQPRPIPAWRILHVRGLSGNGVIGYSPVRVHMEAVGLALATQEYGARLFGNGARPGGVLTHPGRLSPEAVGRLRESWASAHEGLSNSHRVRILEEGMKFEAVGMPPEEAQFLQTRKFQIQEVARIYRVPLHMVGDLERSTNNNIEHQGLEFLTHTLRPILVNFEQAISRDLLVTAAERRSYFAEHLVDALLRAGVHSRYAAYNTAIMAGFMSRNEVRERENLNTATGLDTYLVPLNMVESGNPSPTLPASREGAVGGKDETRQEARATAKEIGRERQRLARSQMPLIEDVAGRIVRREVADIRRAIKKYLTNGQDVQGFLLWLGEFYDEHAGFIGRQMRPALESLALLILRQVATELEDDALAEDEAGILEFVAEYVDALGTRWAASSRGELEQILRDAPTQADGEEEVGRRLGDWEATEAEKTGRREATRGVNALAKAAYVLGGIATLVWVADGESCPYCQGLDGKAISINRFFVNGGTNFEPDGAEGPLLVRRSVGHPPLHDGCNCSIVRG